MDAVHASGGRVYADCQYVTTTLDEPGLTDLLRVIDIFAPNQSEAAQLTGSSDPQAAAAKLAEYCPMVIVKCGADGAFAQAGKKVWHSPALKVEVMDTTGAGDSIQCRFSCGAFARRVDRDLPALWKYLWRSVHHTARRSKCRSHAGTTQKIFIGEK